MLLTIILKDSKKRTETVCAHGNTIKRDGSSATVVQQKSEKPHPLLRPRSVAALTVDMINGNSGIEEVPKSQKKEEEQVKVKPQFGLLPTELAEIYPDEPVPAVLIACIEILDAGMTKL